MNRNGMDVIWWTAVIIAFLLTFNMFGGIKLMTYTVASLKYNGSDNLSRKNSENPKTDKKDNKKGSFSEKPIKKSKSSGDSNEGISGSKDVLKSNVLEDFNNISKYNVELDDDMDKKRELANEAVKVKRESMAIPSKELSDLLVNGGTKSNYQPDQAFNNEYEEDYDKENNDEEYESENEEEEECKSEEVEVEEVASEENNGVRDLNNWY
ncbi:hypothetical protein PIROE2DRAFT_5828 [Piromyces sp. E2]|nr:hypothetical protein PIROE2DRAFT_5828 [Piromyces sp. E2]|eukprot:OUM66848.1 hypothetical protein PIROE2DRAFT_5828 [Piromyces sp. E2]